MKTTSTSYGAALAAPVQQPGVFVAAAFSTTLRWSSRDTRVWNGFTWTAQSMRVEDLQIGALKVTGRIVLDNRDGVAGALVLGEGVQDRRFDLWTFDAGAGTAANDVVWLTQAVGRNATVDQRGVTIELAHPAENVLAPRRLVGVATGFTQLLPAGSSLRINGINYTLERR